MKTTFPFVAALAGTLGLLILFTACSFPSSRRMVSARSANVMQNVDLGTVTSVRQVTIEGRRTNLGRFGGGVIGAAAATPVGSSVSRVAALGQAGAGVAGAVGGEAVEEAVTRQDAQEITVQLDSGQTVVVTQASATGLFQDGDRVRVLHTNGEAQVAMATN